MYEFNYPIENAWGKIKKVKEVERALILDGYWDRQRHGFFVILYDLNNDELIRFLDRSVVPHIKIENEPNRNISDKPIEKIQLYDPLTEKMKDIFKVPTLQDNIYFNYKIGKGVNLVNKAVDFDMLYFHEKQITPGSIVKIEKNNIEILTVEGSSDIRTKLMGTPEEIIELAEENMPLLEQDIPDLKRVAFDIEVNSPRGIFPVPDKAAFKVHAIGVYDSHGSAHMFMLGFEPTKSERVEILMELGYIPKIHNFISEKQLLTEFFKFILQYPIILSYNGDNFDLPYLKNRALKLGMNPPIFLGFEPGNYRTQEYHFQNSIHLDLFRFFANNSVRLYAFGAKYSSLKLDDVSSGLLNSKKKEHDLWFDEMNRTQMVAYTVRDVELTLRLTTFSDSLTIAVMLMIMRVGKMTLTKVNRSSISNWIKNWIAFEHSRKGWILPNRGDLKSKGVFDSNAGIDGKQYQGAIVFEPTPGVYWDVTVADYASLYPSVIKNFRLSYETLRCKHKACKLDPESQVPELSHWVCKNEGIMSSLVGYVRDIRVKHYKNLASDGETEKIKTLAKTIQAALKVFINASYGVFGNSKFAFFCPPVAESTTAYSRHALLQAKALAEQMGYEVVYGDTDSIFVHKLTEADFQKLQAWSIVELGIELGIDYRFRYLVLSSRKKNYFGIKTDNGTITKGLQVKKSNTSQFIKELYSEILEILIPVENAQELESALEKMKSRISRVKDQINNGTIPINKLSRMVTLNKEFDSYETKTPAVQVAIQIMSKDNQEEFQQGTQFHIVSTKPTAFVVTTDKFTKFPQGFVMECNYQEVDNVDPYKINWKKYLEELKKAFTPIFESFDLDWDQAINHYTSLDQFLEI